MMPACSSTHLGKNKKLMEIPKPESNLMDCKSKDLKKWTHTTIPKGGTQVSNKSLAPETSSPDINQSRNGATTPPMAKVQHEEMEQSMEHSTLKAFDVDQKAEVMESITEDKEQEEDRKPATVRMGKTQSKRTSALSGETEKAGEERNEEAALGELKDDPSDNSSNNPAEDAAALANGKEAEKEASDGVQGEDLALLDEELELIKEVDLKEWWCLHDKWLHAAMRATMGILH